MGAIGRAHFSVSDMPGTKADSKGEGLQIPVENVPLLF